MSTGPNLDCLGSLTREPCQPGSPSYSHTWEGDKAAVLSNYFQLVVFITSTWEFGQWPWPKYTIRASTPAQGCNQQINPETQTEFTSEELSLTKWTSKMWKKRLLAQMHRYQCNEQKHKFFLKIRQTWYH